MWRARLALGAMLLLALTSSDSIATPADELLDLGLLKGRVVYVDFWASWCAPCRESFPWMNRLQQELGPKGLVIVAVNVDRERAEAERFVHEHPPRFRIVFDADGSLPEKFGVQGMPTSFLIDRDGHIRSRHDGFRLADRDTLAQQVRSLVLAQANNGG
ncbi:MAG TPA: TlpA disulfide reductase family protein [Steroidobacteraceae bacterium]|nr:TlpA disulfide reductase family protein [Steroidobacteraceae bacterium]